MGKLGKKAIQIYLAPAQELALRYLANLRRTSIAEIVRRSVDRYLEQELPPDQDPALELVGLGHSGLGDLSIRHDSYIVGPLEHKPTND